MFASRTQAAAEIIVPALERGKIVRERPLYRFHSGVSGRGPGHWFRDRPGRPPACSRAAPARPDNLHQPSIYRPDWRVRITRNKGNGNGSRSQAR